MTKEYEKVEPTDVIGGYFESALRHCLAIGIPLETAACTMVAISCGAAKGILPADAARREILRLRDEMYAEMTLAADRCKPGS